MIRILTTLCLLSLFLVGCFALPVEPPLLMPPVVTVPEPVTFTTVAVRRGDVRSYGFPSAHLAPTDEVELFFPFDGIQIAGIYVWVGDIVEAGDIVASLYLPELEAEIEALEVSRNSLALELAHAEAQRQMTINHAGASDEPIDDIHFENTIRGISGELSVIDVKLSFLRDDYDSLYLRTDVSGIVRTVTQFYEGMLSFTSGEWPLVSVADFGEPFFVVVGQAEVFLMNVGDRYDMHMHDVAWPMVVVDPEEYGIDIRDEWVSAAFLMFEDEAPFLLPGSFGRVYMPFGSAYDVVYVENSDLREAGGRYFVYLYEGGLRTIRDVVPGLFGNTTVEIINGLHEGELLIR